MRRRVKGMCIIDRPVNKVAKTKIFSMPCKEGKRQLTVYTNAVDTSTENIMCLPVPNPWSVHYESVPKELFEQCKKSFPDPPQRPREVDYSWSYLAISISDEPLTIENHGSYEVALVPSLYEFHRIPGTFVILTEDVKRFLFNNYPPDWGVLLCKLKEGVNDYEPFAYSHEIHEGTLFLPTKHYHVDKKGGNHADWDHDIYLLYIAEEVGDVSEEGNWIRWKEMPLQFRVGPDWCLRRIQKKGGWYPNEDMRIGA